MAERDGRHGVTNVGRNLVSEIADAWSRLTATLDLDDALQAVVDEARSITNARYGVLVTVDDAGARESLVSSGINPVERQRLWALPVGEKLLAELSQIQGPMRLPDFPSYAQSLDLPGSDMLPESFLGAPMRHLGNRLGNIFLGGKIGGGGFTQNDEEILGMFAAHAAVVLTNARTYRDEQRARAELEALVNDSPLGVLVFDAKTGNLLTVNEETRRIVGGMRGRGHSLEALLSVMTFRQPDGRELGLDELPLTRALSSGATIRAEEVVIEHADGQTVSTLVSAKPIYSDDGEPVSVVATIQDLTPLDEIERQRSEFLGMVSRGLRTPLTTIKGSTATVLSATSPPDPAELLQYFRIIDDQADRLRELTADLLDVSRIETGKLSIAPQPTAVGDVVGEAVRAFERTVATQRLRVTLAPEIPDIVAERSRIVQVLRNLLHTAAALSPAGSTIGVTAAPSDTYVTMSIAFKGVEVSPEDLPHLFSKLYRLTGGDEQTESTNIGLAVSKGIVEAHGGRIGAQIDGSNHGLRFDFTIPVVTLTDESVEPVTLPHPHPQVATGEPIAILAIDKDLQLLKYVREVLSDGGYAPAVASTPDEVARINGKHPPQLVLVGPMLLGSTGFELDESQLEINDASVIFVAERDRDQDITLAFELGASDYIVKPFSPNELLARISIALRRQATPQQSTTTGIFQLGDLVINNDEHSLSVSGRPVRLTATEYKLLVVFANNHGRVLTHDYLLQTVWGRNYIGDSELLRTYVRYLRKKLGDDARNPRYIQTEPRIGYRMMRPDTNNGSESKSSKSMKALQDFPGHPLQRESEV